MKFGIHSLLFTETFLEKDLPLLEKCKQLGFDAVEIIPFDPDNFPAKQVKKVAGDLGLTINTGYGLPEQYNTISPDPQVRKAGVDYVLTKPFRLEHLTEVVEAVVRRSPQVS